MCKKIFFTAAYFLLLFAAVQAGEKPSAQLTEYLKMCVEESYEHPLDPDMKSAMRFHREYQSSYDVIYADKKYFSYIAQEFAYTGGAHGSTRVSAGSLRRGSGERITIKEIAPTAALQKKLLELIVEGCAKHFKCSIKKLQGNLLKKPFLTSNFYLDAKGITFVFNEYDIACFAAGTIKIFVPYTQYQVNLK